MPVSAHINREGKVAAQSSILVSDHGRYRTPVDTATPSPTTQRNFLKKASLAGTHNPDELWPGAATSFPHQSDHFHRRVRLARVQMFSLSDPRTSFHAAPSRDRFLHSITQHNRFRHNQFDSLCRGGYLPSPPCLCYLLASLPHESLTELTLNCRKTSITRVHISMDRSSGVFGASATPTVITTTACHHPASWSPLAATAV